MSDPGASLLSAAAHPEAPDGGWAAGAFDRAYVAFDPGLLALNDSLCGELLVACHVIGVPAPGGPDDDVEAEAPAPPARPRAPGRGGAPPPPPPDQGGEPLPDTGPFVAAAAETFALDRPCLVCRTIEAYKRAHRLSPQWAADYAFLCAKCMAAPQCATAIFVAAFEFVYVMDAHFLRSGGRTLAGAFARFELTINDIHRHFFLHCCFRTDGGLPGPPPPKQPAPRAAASPGTAKVQYSNFSFLAQSATRALLGTLAAGGEEGAGAVQGPQPSLATALMNWKECARLLDCTEGRRGGGESCCTRAVARNAEFEAREATARGRAPAETWGHADLILLLLAGTPAVWEPEPRLRAAAAARGATVARAWDAQAAARSRGVAARFAQFGGAGARPDAELGPLLATVLKHGRSRGRTGGECLLCNLLLVRAYWLALRRLRAEVVRYSDNNTSLFDCIAPVVDRLAADPEAQPDDGGRFAALLRAAGPEAIFKHMFCDPMCAIAEIEVDPRVLFGHPSADDGEELLLHKARLACGNEFGGRVCTALRALIYAFKTYQVFLPRPTALATFVREAGALLRRHSISLLSLEHTLSTYV
ncbi:DNA packaging protein UL32 [Macacine alphaherpesvirus 3]|uniref:Packaging protein UL32 n=1 Tax=Macacine alphaherpesvirus 3 TaxID=2845555 RepID=A0A1X9WFC9_9ALPH|nr:DNA packaging protein UL32 [Macacine alphaherpesvirus 1]ARS01819.1 DNA packaging protein UL32 [Macacine alphaherpesvirus 3]